MGERRPAARRITCEVAAREGGGARRIAADGGFERERERVFGGDAVGVAIEVARQELRGARRGVLVTERADGVDDEALLVALAIGDGRGGAMRRGRSDGG